MIWKSLLGLDNIYASKRLSTLFINAFFAVPFGIVGFIGLIIVSFFVDLSPKERLLLDTPLFVFICFFAFAWFTRQLARTLYVKRILRRRQYLGKASAYSISQIASSAASEEMGKIGKISLIKESKGWKIYDAIFYVIHRTRSGQERIAKESYYTVFESKLNREVPHLLFDAKKAKGKQFGRLYLKAQKLSLGGTFEDYFEAYAPKHYQIDTLSFITPEVLEAMIAMRQYDIELLNGHLLCYAPLLEGKDLAAFEAHCLHLHRHINNNLRSYKDDRLTNEKRQDDVADFGKQLLKNPFRKLPLVIFFGLATLTILVLALLIDWEILYNQFSIFIIVFFVVLVVDIFRIKRQNSRKEALFLAGQQSPDGKQSFN